MCAKKERGAFALIRKGVPATIYADPQEYLGVLRAAGNLKTDLGSIAGGEGAIRINQPVTGDTAIIVGTLEKSQLIRRLVDSGKVDASGLEDEWEAFVQQVVDDPMPGVDRALVIVGSDKRGAIYGVYDLDERAGVSPWAWWADVPVEQKKNLYVAPGRRFEKPAVKYRGIFINDENPSLYGWVNETFGGFNHKFYEKVFDLILRMKGNYLWPAMWGKAFYDDDAQNAPLADEMGVVIGTSHHEPLARAHVEWARYGKGPWDYAKNAKVLRAFWRKGMERRGDNEAVITVGMRGDGDKAMTQGTAIDLLERIVTDQRKIIADVTGKPASETPQIWALYKEVQDYYDKGMKVPDDITLLFADDNWGNIRRLPKPGAKRPGGYGVYYHFDYVGEPRNYKWINTTEIERVWEQMHIAYDYGARQMWIVNVGDLKPMEFPISFFLDYAWNPDATPLERLADYPRQWAAEQFGEKYADEIGELLTRYTSYNARRKPELLSPDTYSLVNFDEADRVVADYDALFNEADALRAKLPKEYDDAYMQLVWFPIAASANLNELYVAAAKNRLYAKQGRASANDYAAKVKELFARDAELTRIYNKEIAGGKWNHMMDQTHIGYTYWQQPDQNNMPEVKKVEPAAGAVMGIAVEGDKRAWPGAEGAAKLPAIDVFNKQSRWIDVFNRGDEPFEFSAKSDASWLKVSPANGAVEKQTRLFVSADWKKAPKGNRAGSITITGPNGAEETVRVDIANPENARAVSGFVEANGYVAMEAVNYARAVDGDSVEWKIIPDLGKTDSSVTMFPVTAAAQTPGGDAPHLEYDIYTFDSGDFDVEVTLAPTLDFKGRGGLRYAVSIDDGAPVVVNVDAPASTDAWDKAVSDYAHKRTTKLSLAAPGAHTVKLWMVDPGLVFQRVVVSKKAPPESYLGPPQSALVSGRR